MNNITEALVGRISTGWCVGIGWVMPAEDDTTFRCGAITTARAAHDIE